MKKYPILFILLGTCLTLEGQIINTELSRIRTDTLGWFGSLSAATSFLMNDKSLFSVDFNSQVERKSKNHLWLFLATYHFAKGNQTRFADEGFVHVRHNVGVKKGVKWESFCQIQKNSIQNIGERILVGAGPRFKLAESKLFRLYLGVLGMYEFEREKTDREVVTKVFRNSNYISFSLIPGQHVTLENTTYFQPSFARFSDHRLLTDWRCRVKISKKFSFISTFIFLYDSVPATDGNTRIIRQMNGITYTF